MITVVMITYGHEDYIRKAIEGVLMQKCDFLVELLIANDSSPDNTDIIVRDILKNHPKSNSITYIKHKKNIGMIPNFIFALNEARGKYIALCEGDDYWTDPYKLQKQLDVLEGNQEYIGCYHRVEILNETSNKINYSDIYHEPIDNAVTDDVLKNHLIPTLSLVFRNEEKIFFPEWFSESPVGDIPLELILSLKGSFKYLDDCMGVYRYTDKGISSANDRKINYTFYRFIKMYSFFNSYTNKKFDTIIFNLIYQRMQKLKKKGEYSLLLRSFKFIDLDSFYRVKILFYLLIGKKYNISKK